MGLVNAKLIKPKQKKQYGFTVVELIVVLIVLGIMAAVAMPRFFSSNKFVEMGYADTVANSVRYAQKLAVASGCDTRIKLTNTGYELFQRNPNCASSNIDKPVIRPGGQNWQGMEPSGVTVSPIDIYFDNLGRPYQLPANTLITSATCFDIGSREYKIEALTGFLCPADGSCVCS